MYLKDVLDNAYLKEVPEQGQEVLLVGTDLGWCDIPMVIRKDKWEEIYVHWRASEPDLEVIARLMTKDGPSQFRTEFANEEAVRERYMQLRTEKTEAESALAPDASGEPDAVEPAEQAGEVASTLAEEAPVPLFSLVSFVDQGTTVESAGGSGAEGNAETPEAAEDSDRNGSAGEQPAEPVENTGEEDGMVAQESDFGTSLMNDDFSIPLQQAAMSEAGIELQAEFTAEAETAVPAASEVALKPTEDTNSVAPSEIGDSQGLDQEPSSAEDAQHNTEQAEVLAGDAETSTVPDEISQAEDIADSTEPDVDQGTASTQESTPDFGAVPITVGSIVTMFTSDFPNVCLSEKLADVKLYLSDLRESHEININVAPWAQGCAQFFYQMHEDCRNTLASVTVSAVLSASGYHVDSFYADWADLVEHDRDILTYVSVAELENASHFLTLLRVSYGAALYYFACDNEERGYALARLFAKLIYEE